MFDNVAPFLALIPLLPLLASVLIVALRKSLGAQSHLLCIAGAVGAFVCSVITLVAVANGKGAYVHYATWFQVDNVEVGLSLQADALTAVMLVMVTFIGSFIAIYAAGYMKGDPGYPRFFTAVSGFLFFMTGLVLANNFIILYACWEGVGLCSYLLIGFWFARPAAAAAARKAFLVTRLGDIGLFIGILLLWNAQPTFPSLEFNEIFGNVASLNPNLVFWVCVCLFIGAAGKSAQFPLHVWLPDAMEGPSPVSALIHAATMVTAGVYLVARCTPLFAASPDAQLIVAVIGGITALLAALIALTQTDLKRVLAYSTLSQLGYMFMALGAGINFVDGEGATHRLAGFAVTAAIFHLFTHAFFKALLFLGAGSVMHAMGNVIDMRRFRGLRKVLPATHWTFLCGALALAGFPLISGFWSKDEILGVLLEASHGERGGVYLALFVVAIVTAGLTAFYTFRAYFMTFCGELRIPEEAFSHHGHDSHEAHDSHGHEAHGHAEPAASHAAAPLHVHDANPSHDNPPHDHTKLESPLIMTIPLMVLAVGALGVGAALGPTHLFGDFLHNHWMKEQFKNLVTPAPVHHMDIALMAGSSLVGLLGIALAYVMYVKKQSLPERIAQRIPLAYELSRNKFYLDEIYAALIVNPLTMLTHVLRIFDAYIIDGLVDLVGQIPPLVGYLFRPIQNGLVQFYALLMALGLAGFVLSVLLR